jgi:quinol monooxygenase YgiN
MPVTQIIEFRTDNIEECLRLDHEYLQNMSAEKRQQLFDRGQTIADKDDPGHFFVVLEYESLEAAEAAGEIPDSKKLMEDVSSLVKGEIKFFNCDVLSYEVKPSA